MRKKLKTPKDVRGEFERAGLSIGKWAEEHGFSRQTVYGVLSGRHKGTRGKSHRIAVALGLKDGVVISARDFCQPQEVA